MGAHPSCPGPYNLVVVREGRNVSLGLCLYGGMGVGGQVYGFFGSLFIGKLKA